jgi:hypothetical protein
MKTEKCVLNLLTRAGRRADSERFEEQRIRNAPVSRLQIEAELRSVRRSGGFGRRTDTAAGSDHLEVHSRSPFQVWWLILLVIGVAGTFLYSAVQRQDIFKTQAGKPPLSLASDLGLTAEWRGADMLLSWNHDAPAIMTATEGTLIILAENSTQQIVLTPSQLRSGRVLYSPTAVQFDIRLEVRSPGQPVAEGNIVISRAPIPTAPPEPASAPPEPSSNVSAAQIAEGASQPVPPESNSLANKSESKLHLSSSGSVVMLAREASAAAQLRDNPSNLPRLIQSGSLFSAAPGTEVAAKQMENRLVKVRIMSGINAGREGWVDISQVGTK